MMTREEVEATLKQARKFGGYGLEPFFESLLAHDQAQLAMIEQQAKEIARLREALQACGSKLYEATAYIGYQGVGPLHEPATEMILRRAEEAIKETPGQLSF